MIFRKITCFVLMVLTSFFISSGLYAGVKFNQLTKIQADGSVLLSITYSANTAEIKSNKIGNLPFTTDLVKQDFAFPNGEIKKALVYKDPANANVTMVTLDILTKDMRQVTSSKAFAGTKSGWGVMDTGTVTTWTVTKSFMENNSVDTYQYTISIIGGTLKSSNGVIKGNDATWFIFKDKVHPDGSYFLTTFTPNYTAATTDSKDTGSNSSSGSDGKSCGLFGFELPFILMLGFAAGSVIRKKKQ